MSSSSKNAVDHYFRMCEEMRVQISPDIRYFCISNCAYYLEIRDMSQAQDLPW